MKGFPLFPWEWIPASGEGLIECPHHQTRLLWPEGEEHDQNYPPYHPPQHAPTQQTVEVNPVHDEKHSRHDHHHHHRHSTSRATHLIDSPVSIETPSWMEPEQMKQLGSTSILPSTSSTTTRGPEPSRRSKMATHHKGGPERPPRHPSGPTHRPAHHMTHNHDHPPRGVIVSSSATTTTFSSSASSSQPTIYTTTTPRPHPEKSSSRKNGTTTTISDLDRWRSSLTLLTYLEREEGEDSRPPSAFLRPSHPQPPFMLFRPRPNLGHLVTPAPSERRNQEHHRERPQTSLPDKKTRRARARSTPPPLLKEESSMPRLVLTAEQIRERLQVLRTQEKSREYRGMPDTYAAFTSTTSTWSSSSSLGSRASKTSVQQQHHQHDVGKNPLHKTQSSARSSWEGPAANFLTWSSRYQMGQWYRQVAQGEGLPNEVPFIALNYLDRVVSTWQQRGRWPNMPGSFPEGGAAAATLEQYRLLSLTCLFLAVKLYGPARTVTPRDMAHLGGGVFTARQVADMENVVLETLQWRVHPPTAWEFLHLYLHLFASTSTQSSSSNSPQQRLVLKQQPHLYQEMLELATKMIENSMLDSYFYQHDMKPSLVAAAAFSNAVFWTLPPGSYEDPIDVLMLKGAVHFDEDKLMMCCTRLCDLINAVMEEENSRRRRCHCMPCSVMPMSKAKKQKQQLHFYATQSPTSSVVSVPSVYTSSGHPCV